MLKPGETWGEICEISRCKGIVALCPFHWCFSRGKKQKIDISIIDIVEAVENTKQNYRQLLKHVEKDPASILKLFTLKLIIDDVEANEDGEPRYQDVNLKHFLREKGYIVNHC